MKDISRILRTWEGLLGKRTASVMGLRYEDAYQKGIILLPPPTPDISKGEYVLGKVIWSNAEVGDFGLRENELGQHISIFGRTGAGKTNAAFLLLQQLLDKGNRFLVFDWKQTYRGMASQKQMKLYTPGQDEAPLFFNPLNLSAIPENLHDAYLRHLVAVWLDVYFRELRLLTTEGAEYLFLRGIETMRTQQQQLTFQNLYSWLLQYPSVCREKDWKVSLSNVLHKMTTGPIGRVLQDHHEPVDIGKLLTTCSVIELHWLGSPKDKVFLMQTLLLQLYYHVSQLGHSPSLRFFVLVEEAHNILLRHAQGYETVMEMVLRQVREYGVGICLLDQHPSLISLPARGTYTTIAFSLPAYEDVHAVDNSMALGQDREYLSKLKVGQAIVHLRDRFMKPFLVQFPKAELGSYLPSRKPPVGNLPKSRVIYPGHRLLSQRAKALLLDIADNPITSTSQRYRQLSLNPKQGNELRKELLAQRLIQHVDINTGKARIRLIQPTQEGKMLLREQGIRIVEHRRKGSLVHQYWCQKAKEHFEKKGYGVLEEVEIGKGKAVDLVAINDQERIAIEVETGKSDVVGNVRKCLGANFSKIVVVAVSAHIERQILSRLRTNTLEGPGVRVISLTGKELLS